MHIAAKWPSAAEKAQNVYAFRGVSLRTVLETVRVLRLVNDQHILDQYNRRQPSFTEQAKV